MLCRVVKGDSLCCVELLREICHVLQSCEDIHARVRTMMCHIMRPHTCMPQQIYKLRGESLQVTLQRILAMFMSTRIWLHDGVQHLHEHNVQYLREHPYPKLTSLYMSLPGCSCKGTCESQVGSYGPSGPMDLRWQRLTSFYMKSPFRWDCSEFQRVYVLHGLPYTKLTSLPQKSAKCLSPRRCCSVLQCVAVCCSEMLQCVAVCCSVLQCSSPRRCLVAKRLLKGLDVDW